MQDIIMALWSVEGDGGNYHRAFKHLYFLQGLGTNYLYKVKEGL